MERLDLELDAGAARVYLQFRVFTWPRSHFKLLDSAGIDFSRDALPWCERIG
jgi:hypothetical protein